jgi:FkbM family methyltransferase
MLGPYASWKKESGYATWNAPTAEFVGIFERINVQPKGIIHVGLFDFIEYGCYLKLVGDKIIGVEANPQIYRDMSKPVADKWGLSIFNECLSERDGEEKDFYLAGEGSSLYKGPPQWGKTLENSIKVKTKTLATVMDENNLDPSEYDFLNIDAEGAELEVLKGYERYLEYVNVIDLESSVDDRHWSGCSHNAIVGWLADRGFRLAEMSTDNFQRDGWGDALFVRRDREHTPFKDGNAGTAIWGKGYFEKTWPDYPFNK